MIKYSNEPSDDCESEDFLHSDDDNLDLEEVYHDDDYHT